MTKHILVFLGFCFLHNISWSAQLFSDQWWLLSSIFGSPLWVSVTKLSFFSLKEFFLFLSSSGSIGGLWVKQLRKIQMKLNWNIYIKMTNEAELKWNEMNLTIYLVKTNKAAELIYVKWAERNNLYSQQQ